MAESHRLQQQTLDSAEQVLQDRQAELPLLDTFELSYQDLIAQGVVDEQDALLNSEGLGGMGKVFHARGHMTNNAPALPSLDTIQHRLSLKQVDIPVERRYSAGPNLTSLSAQIVSPAAENNQHNMMDSNSTPSISADLDNITTSISTPTRSSQDLSTCEPCSTTSSNLAITIIGPATKVGFSEAWAERETEDEQPLSHDDNFPKPSLHVRRKTDSSQHQQSVKNRKALKYSKRFKSVCEPYMSVSATKSAEGWTSGTSPIDSSGRRRSTWRAQKYSPSPFLPLGFYNDVEEPDNAMLRFVLEPMNSIHRSSSPKPLKSSRLIGQADLPTRQNVGESVNDSQAESDTNDLPGFNFSTCSYGHVKCQQGQHYRHLKLSTTSFFSPVPLQRQKSHPSLGRRQGRDHKRKGSRKRARSVMLPNETSSFSELKALETTWPPKMEAPRPSADVFGAVDTTTKDHGLTHQVECQDIKDDAASILSSCGLRQPPPTHIISLNAIPPSPTKELLPLQDSSPSGTSFSPPHASLLVNSPPKTFFGAYRSSVANASMTSSSLQSETFGNHVDSSAAMLDLGGLEFEHATHGLEQDVCGNKLVVSGSIEQLVGYLTSVSDPVFVDDFLLTYRTFMSPMQLLKLFIVRLKWCLKEDQEPPAIDSQRRFIKLQTCQVLTSWISGFWDEDFGGSRTMLFTLSTFLTILESSTLHGSDGVGGPDLLDGDADEDLKAVLELKALVEARTVQPKQQNDTLAETIVATSTPCLPSTISTEPSTHSQPPLAALPPETSHNFPNPQYRDRFRLCKSTSLFNLRNSVLGTFKQNTSSIIVSSSSEGGGSARSSISESDSGSQTIPHNNTSLCSSGPLIAGVEEEQQTCEGALNLEPPTTHSTNIPPTNPKVKGLRKVASLSNLLKRASPLVVYDKFLEKIKPSAAASGFGQSSSSSDDKSPEEVGSRFRVLRNLRVGSGDTSLSDYQQSDSSTGKALRVSAYVKQQQQQQHHQVGSQSESDKGDVGFDSPSAMQKGLSARLSHPRLLAFKTRQSQSRPDSPKPITKAPPASSCTTTVPTQPLPTSSSSSPDSPSSIPALSLARSLPNFKSLRKSASTNTLGSKGSYKSPLLDLPVPVVAAQMALTELQVLRGVGWMELLVDVRSWTRRGGGCESGMSGEGKRGGMEVLVDRFNHTCQWVTTEILRTRKPTHRALLIETFIALASESHRLSNFASLMQILLGLQNSNVERLRKTWGKVSTGSKNVLDALGGYVCPLRNFRELRKAMNELARRRGGVVGDVAGEGGGGEVLQEEEEEEEGKEGGRWVLYAVPFTGLYLGDLVFVAQIPTFIERPERLENDEEEESMVEEEEEDDDDDDDEGSVEEDEECDEEWCGRSCRENAESSSEPLNAESTLPPSSALISVLTTTTAITVSPQLQVQQQQQQQQQQLRTPTEPSTQRRINFHKMRVMAKILREFRAFHPSLGRGGILTTAAPTSSSSSFLPTSMFSHGKDVWEAAKEVVERMSTEGRMMSSAQLKKMSLLCES
ncbi:Guanine nucleotide exchange factor lte1 [Chytridiales sp. JEL 0842]|nr:Guanine nucleotide exchange factor lte1 [Chytridiales sp. JEL 0842]